MDEQTDRHTDMVAKTLALRLLSTLIIKSAYSRCRLDGVICILRSIYCTKMLRKYHSDDLLNNHCDIFCSIHHLNVVKFCLVSSKTD